MSDFANIGWVVDLGNVTSGGGSTLTHFGSVLAFRRSGKTRKLVSHAI